MKCFGECFVGLKGSCKYGDPSSGFFVNDTPEISMKRLANLANEETVRGENFFKELHDQVARELPQKLLTKISSKYVFNKVIETKTVGRRGGTFGDKYCGLIGLEFEKTNQDKFTYLHIDSIEILASKAAGKKIYIYDEEEPIVKEVRLKKGVNKINLNHKSCNDFVIVAFDSCDLQIPESSYCGCAQSHCGHCDCSCVNVRGVREVDEVFEHVSNYNGIVACVSCRCSAEPFICSIKDSLAYPFSLWFAVLFNKNILNTDRNNPLSRNNKEQARRNIIDLIGGEDLDTGFEKKGSFNEALEALAEQLKNYNYQSKCFSCENRPYISDSF